MFDEIFKTVGFGTVIVLGTIFTVAKFIAVRYLVRKYFRTNGDLKKELATLNQHYIKALKLAVLSEEQNSMYKHTLKEHNIRPVGDSLVPFNSSKGWTYSIEERIQMFEQKYILNNS